MSEQATDEAAGQFASTEGNWRPQSTSWLGMPDNHLPRSGASAPSSIGRGGLNADAVTFGADMGTLLPASSRASAAQGQELWRPDSTPRKLETNSADDTTSTQVPSAEAGLQVTLQSATTQRTEWPAIPSATQEEFFKAMTEPNSQRPQEMTALPLGLRADTPILAYVDRVSMPGFLDYEEREAKLQQLDRDLELQQASYWRSSQSPAEVPEAHEPALQVRKVPEAGLPPQQAMDDWEAELEAWKQQYGCGREETELVAEPAAEESAPGPCEAPRVLDAAPGDLGPSDKAGDLSAIAQGEEVFPGALAPDCPPPTMLARREPQIAEQQLTVAPSSGSRPGDLPAARKQSSDLAPRESVVNAPIVRTDLYRPSLLEAGDDFLLAAGEDGVPQHRPPSPVQEHVGEEPQAVLARSGVEATPSRGDHIEGAAASLIHLDGNTAPSNPAKASQEEGSPGLSRDFTFGKLVPLRELEAEEDPLHGHQSRPDLSAKQPEEVPAPPATLALVPRPPSPQDKAASPPSRRYVYTKEDLQLATEDAKIRLRSTGTWRGEFSESGMQKRDFMQDLRRHREADKGRPANGPLWLHLAQQAKNLADTLDLAELLEAIKLFCSARYSDYELYMRLLGEIPRYIAEANAAQLCELVRMLARRRLRERNYIDMVGAHLLQKIRATDDTMHARLLVKTANAFAALDCRSHAKFVEHFLRHMEHRIEELDAPLCCQVSPLFVASYMTDALRRAYLKRCAELQAGFHGELEECRNMAQIEFILRKEHHSLLASMPAFVGRYLEKMRKHAAFEKWGTVTLPPAVAPHGPKGSHKAEISSALQMKASTQPLTGSNRADVFSSDMHRDVSACLTHLGIEHENGVLCGPFLLDIVALDMVNPTKRLVYEVNAEHHYYEGTDQLTAEKRLRHRMLGRLGQKLHMVNTKEWRSLTAAQKINHLLKLQQAQQDENTKDLKQQAAANTMRASLPAITYNSAAKPEPLKLKSIRDLSAPIRVPVPPSLQRSSPERPADRRRLHPSGSLSAR